MRKHLHYLAYRDMNVHNGAVYWQSKYDFSWMGGILFTVLWGMILSSVMAWLFGLVFNLEFAISLRLIV